MTDSSLSLGPEAWNERYANNDTPWDLAGPTPELVRLLEGKRWRPPGRVLVPGGGRGHDAVLFARSGFEVDLVDFAPGALEAALQLASQEKKPIYAYRRNFFDLPEVGYHQASYDLLFEYTFFCAISPQDRPRYVRAAAALLKPGGFLIGIFFPTASDKAGPPFVVSKEEVEKLFAPHFELHFEQPELSVKPRDGREFLGIFKRK